MRIFSNLGLAKLLISLLIIFWLFIISIIVLNHCLSCLTIDGCLRVQCDYNWLKDEYKILIDKNKEKCENRNILFPNLTTIIDPTKYNSTNITNSNKTIGMKIK